MRRRFFVAAALSLLTSFVAASVAAAPADPASFYRGRTIQLLIGFGPTGGYDTYARTLARHMGKHIPGNPTIVPQNMPGAGSLKVANYIYNAAPKDGTVIATFARGLPMEKLLGRTAGQAFDATKFTWIGSITDEPSVCAFWHTSAIHTWEDMKSKQYKLGGSGLLTDLDIYSNVLRNMFHLPGRLISGFPGGADVVLAMQRREVDGRCGWSWSSLSGLDRQMLDQKLVTVPLQLGVEKIRRAAGRPARARSDERSEGEGGAEADLLAPGHGAAVRRRSRSAARARQGAARRVRRHDEGPRVPRRYGAPETRSAAGPRERAR